MCVCVFFLLHVLIYLVFNLKVIQSFFSNVLYVIITVVKLENKQCYQQAYVTLIVYNYEIN